MGVKTAPGSGVVVVWHQQRSAGRVWCRFLYKAEVEARGVRICCPLLGIAGKLSYGSITRSCWLLHLLEQLRN